MSKIKQLPLHEIQKIAAGEVVERPANVVKELIENALDAGATRISIFIRDGGKQSIRIVDNGCGMSTSDAHLCILHHATSKIEGINDLPTLMTYGFRGEALSSIAAVSECTITTKEASALEGIRLTINAGTIVREETIACQQGTDITINNLFYNVPARKKFLKTTATEWRAIVNLVQAYCLTYPSCHIMLQHDDHLVINCAPASTALLRIEQLFGASLTTQLLACSTGDVNTVAQCTGFISNPQHTRYDRSMFFFFVNKRWIKNTKLAHAIMQGYAGVLPPGKFPIACLFIEIDPRIIDINIHPRKEEVQFLHPHKVEHLIKEMIIKRLNTYRSHQLGSVESDPVSHKVNTVNPLSLPPLQNKIATFNQYAQNIEHSVNTRIPDTTNIQEFEAALAKSFSTDSLPIHTTQHSIPEPPLKNILGSESTYHLIGQLHTTYLLLETPQGLVIIDQHAAHERILYEQFAQRFKAVPCTSLIFPLVITVSHKDSLILMQYKDIFIDHGISIDQQGEHQFVISSLPVHAKEHNIKEFIHEVIGWIHELQEIDPALFFEKLHERMRAQMACKAAVKAGDILTKDQMHELIANLHKTDNRLTCPHGRPTSWIITQYEIERMFKRKR